MTQDLSSIISEELNIPRKAVNATLKLLDDGATIPFISRYRKEATGALDEVAIHNIKLRAEALRELNKRKEYIISVLSASGNLTPELTAKINDTLDSATLEDIYLPYKPKRRTRATMAREKGLEPLAKIIMAQNSTGLKRQAAKFVNGTVESVDEALNGAMDIVAEWVSESEKSRNIVRSRYLRSAVIASKVVAGKESEAQNYQNYFNFSEPLRTCTSHRYLALRRAEADGLLKVLVSIDDKEITDRLGRMFVKAGASPECAEYVRTAVTDSYRRLIRPSIESEVAAIAKDKADKAAIDMFADNVRQLLLASPLFNKRVLAIDPGFRTGCKVVCLDEQGNLMAHDVIYPCAPVNDYNGAAYKICYMVDRYG
ncbi:MAG: RNA-binding transcriptional accessory protein, partial [Muribaculaceae bacterium]|nr:RNA-binding transcriptional accessory protein [Muribaculaceae bacterium]